jgi:hypothetical protein
MKNSNNLPHQQSDAIKPNFNAESLTGHSLKSYLIFRFGSIRAASIAAGWSDDSRLVQIFAGYKIPKFPPIIQRLSEAWQINAVVLTQLFQRLSNKEGKI